MNEAVIPLGKTGNLVRIFQERYVDGAIRHIAADACFADALHAEGILEKFCRFFGIRNGQSDMTKPRGHGTLLSVLASASAGPWRASSIGDWSPLPFSASIKPTNVLRISDGADRFGRGSASQTVIPWAPPVGLRYPAASQK